jgi:hypothetical protein
MFYIDLETITTDRYDLAKFMDYANDGVFDPLNSYLLLEIPRLPAIGIYTIQEEQNRPDILSYKLYKDTQYWWVLMWYNSIATPQDLKIGLKISYPSLSSLEQLYMNATLLQKTV